MEKVGASWGRGTSEEFQSGMWERVVSCDEGRCWDSEPAPPLAGRAGSRPSEAGNGGAGERGLADPLRTAGLFVNAWQPSSVGQVRFFIQCIFIL